MDKNIFSSIKEIDEKLLHFPDDFSLYYERGYLYYLTGNEKQAQNDYIKAVNLGLDCTNKPYYKFRTPTYSYNIFQKISLIIALIFVLFLIISDFWRIFLQIKQHF